MSDVKLRRRSPDPLRHRPIGGMIGGGGAAIVGGLPFSPGHRLPVGRRGLDRERVFRTLTFWLRPAFALRVLHRFQRIAGFDRAVALASSALTAVIPLALVSSALLSRVGVEDFS